MILTREQALEIFKRRVSVRYYDPARKISGTDFAARNQGWRQNQCRRFCRHP